MPKEIDPQIVPTPDLFVPYAGPELEYLAEAMQPGGFLAAMAARMVEPGNVVVTPDDAVAVFEYALKPNYPDGTARPRGEIMETAPKKLKAMCEEEPNKTAIMSLARVLDIRQDETHPAWQIEAVTADPKDIVLYQRCAANKTGPVRSAVVEGALPLIEEAHGVTFEDPIIWQFGTPRPVPILRKDGSPNPEYGIARKLAPDFLPADQDSTEFKNNVAIAKQAGFVRYDSTADEQVDRIREIMHHNEVDRFRHIMQRNELGIFMPMRHATDPGRPRRFAIQSNLPGEVRAVADLAVLHQLLPGGLNGKQIIAGDNGQYRKSLELFIKKFAAENDVTYAADPVVFGDEAGFTVEHKNVYGSPIETIKTADRPPTVYLAEALVIWNAARARQV